MYSYQSVGSSSLVSYPIRAVAYVGRFVYATKLSAMRFDLWLRQRTPLPGVSERNKVSGWAKLVSCRLWIVLWLGGLADRWHYAGGPPAVGWHYAGGRLAVRQRSVT